MNLQEQEAVQQKELIVDPSSGEDINDSNLIDRHNDDVLSAAIATT
jgi:hypothetical protein